MKNPIIKNWRPRKKDIRLLFDVLNEFIFDNKLPYFNRVYVRRLRGVWARTYWAKIWDHSSPYFELDVKTVYPTFDFFVATLAHEMIHIYQVLTEGKTHHGNSFKKWSPKIRQYCDSPIYDSVSDLYYYGTGYSKISA